MGPLRATGTKPIEDAFFWMGDDKSIQNCLSVNKRIMKNRLIEQSDGLAKCLAAFLIYMIT